MKQKDKDDLQLLFIGFIIGIIIGVFAVIEFMNIVNYICN